MTIEELKAKVMLGSMLIGELYEDPDPRAPEAIEALQEQQRELNKLLVAKIREEQKERPPPVVVGCEPLLLSGRAKGSPATRQTQAQVVEISSGEDGSIALVLQY